MSKEEIKDRLSNVKSTVIGILLFLTGLGIQIHEYIVSMVLLNTTYPLFLMLIGIGFLFAKDKTLDIIFGWLKKRN